MRPPVVCVVGPSDGGKTLVAEALIQRLSAEGYRVAAVKHAPHGYRLDEPGTDSQRLRAAGAERVAVVAPSEWAVLAREEVTLEDVTKTVGLGCDVLVAEGFRASPAPKVLVAPEEADPGWERPEGLVAVVSDHPEPEAPWQCGFGELERLAEFVRERYLTAGREGPEVTLVVDGKRVGLGPFAISMLSHTVWGMLRSLKGIPEEPTEVRLEVRGRPRASKGD